MRIYFILCKKKNKSPNVLCFEDLYNLVFVECGGNIDTSFPLSFIYFFRRYGS